MQWLIRWTARLAAFVWIASFWPLGQLPRINETLPDMELPPLQLPVAREERDISYHGQVDHVTYVASYDIAGIVLSHNDPNVFLHPDITHDDKSLDTRDLCLVSGKTVRGGGYRSIEAQNTDWSCVVRWKDDALPIYKDEISNNHLIASEQSVRDTIASIEIGDQVRLKGHLVNYREARWPPGQERRTSLVRTDSYNGACEIILVDSVEILRSTNHVWRVIHRAAFWLALSCFPLSWWLGRDNVTRRAH